MEARSALEHFKIPRRRTVFISCPGDLVDAKQVVINAVQEVGRLFAPHGCQLTSWCHDIDGWPALGTDGQAAVNEQASADYDIYVGLMCHRLGTPTPRALSGTVEEFLQARQRFIETGKPDILFYFCADPAKPKTKSERLELEKVIEFRKAYPGLFAIFHEVEELKAMVKHHLIDLLLRDPERRCSRKRGWALRLARRLDRLKESPAYLDRSSGFVVRSLGKLETLFDLPSLLSDLEYETLLAAQYIRAFRFCGEDLSSVERVIRESLPAAFDWDGAVLAADLADGNIGLVGGAHKLNGVRCGFLASLLRLSDALDLDSAAITAGTGSRKRPPKNGPIENWLAYVTWSVRVSRGGVVAFHLRVPTRQEALARSLSRSVALLFEARWHRLRAALSANGVAVTRAPMEWVLSRESIAIPDSVLARLDLATKQAKENIQDLQHFGEVLPCPVAIEKLLPLASSAIVQPARFTFHPDLRHKLCLWRENEAGVRELAANRPGEILLDPQLLSPPGARYRWSLQRDDGDFFSEVEAGLIWQLAPADQMRLAAGESLPDPRHALLLRLGLRNDLLEELGPRLVSGRASVSECECVYDAVLATYEWLEANAPESAQVGLIRNFSNWVHKEILNEKGK